MSESNVQKAIIQYLQSSGYYVTRVNSGSVLKSYKNKFGQLKQNKIKLADTGTPDIICCVDGIFIGIEVKKDEAEKKSWLNYPQKYADRKRQFNARIDSQHKAKRRIEKAGGRYLLACSIDDVINFLI